MSDFVGERASGDLDILRRRACLIICTTYTKLLLCTLYPYMHAHNVHVLSTISYSSDARGVLTLTMLQLEADV